MLGLGRSAHFLPVKQQHCLVACMRLPCRLECLTAKTNSKGVQELHSCRAVSMVIELLRSFLVYCAAGGGDGLPSGVFPLFGRLGFIICLCQPRRAEYSLKGNAQCRTNLHLASFDITGGLQAAYHVRHIDPTHQSSWLFCVQSVCKSSFGDTCVFKVFLMQCHARQKSLTFGLYLAYHLDQVHFPRLRHR